MMQSTLVSALVYTSLSKGLNNPIIKTRFFFLPLGEGVKKFLCSQGKANITGDKSLIRQTRYFVRLPEAFL